LLSATTAKPNASIHRASTFGHQPADQRRGQEHGGAGDEQRLSDHQRIEAANLGEIDRIEIGEAVKPNAEHEREHAADGEVAVGEGTQIHDWLPRGEHARKEDHGRAC
jgi:hypothetical protein